jgi:flagellar hook assembly protein FlgD
VNAFENAGTKSVMWDGKNKDGKFVSTGYYFYLMQAGDIIKNHKMILMNLSIGNKKLFMLFSLHFST